VPANTNPWRPLINFTDRLRLWRRRPDSLGALGELAATKMLKLKGYRILAKNLRNRFGEIDIVARAPDEHTIVIVEVKSTQHADIMPELRVDLKKQKRLTALAAQAVRRYKLQNHPIRFDVVAVSLPTDDQPRLRHYEAAFQSHV
jgi:putative endonuclease